MFAVGRRVWFTVLVLLGVGLVPTHAHAQVSVSDVDEVFAAFRGTYNPGCTVAVSEAGQVVLERAYGMADLERNVPNMPDTVLESGSVAKQFTATATVLLAVDGKLSLDDNVRQYVPELPDYGAPITIRHLLNYTSGLRDWGSVAAIGGWPRGRRMHTHAHMLDIASRQKSLNYAPGEYYSYTNTGYNLQAVIVERVTGMSFAEFSKTRIFEPLAMTRTQWRDDYTRIVKDRGIAYSPTADGGYRQNMPFENVHGNGGLLTTVGDLLKFTHNLETGAFWGPEYLQEMHTLGVLTSGREIQYASGLRVGQYKGVREIQHGGATAGYRAFLTRFPDHGLAVALMCNVADANPSALAHQVANLYLVDAVTEAGMGSEPALEVSAEYLEGLAGPYRRVRDRRRINFSVVDGVLTLAEQALTPVGEGRFEGGPYSVGFHSESDGHLNAVVTVNGDRFRLEPVEVPELSAEALTEFEGTYQSDQAEVSYSFEVRDGSLVRLDRYGVVVPLTLDYSDTFSGGGGSWIFGREAGRVTSVNFSQGRVWDLRFERVQ